jgi:hypothetical protein
MKSHEGVRSSTTASNISGNLFINDSFSLFWMIKVSNPPQKCNEYFGIVAFKAISFLY